MCVYVHVCVCALSHVQHFATPWTATPTATVRLLCPWNFPGENTEVGCHFQGIFLTQGWNLCLLHWQVDSLPLPWAHKIDTLLFLEAYLVEGLPL